jgi:hypothetical protein
MKTFFPTFAGVLLMAFALASPAVAVPLEGSFTVTGDIQLTGPAPFTFGSATGVTGWSKVIVNNVEGDFDPYLSSGDTLDLATPWSFNSGGVDDFWTINGFHFDLGSSSVTFQSATALAVMGSGMAWGNGFDATPTVWNFSTQSISADNAFSFSASVAAAPADSVPDGGTTVLLLGAALAGLGLMARRRDPASV